MKFVYLIILAGAAAFYILYKGDISFFLLAFLIVLPPLLFCALAVTAALMKITVLCDSAVTEKGKAVSVKVRINNRSFLPVPACSVTVRYGVSAPFEKSSSVTRTAAVPLGGRTGETVSLSFLPEHCGTVSVYVGYVRLTDLIGLTSLRKKAGFRTEITVLPRVFPIIAAVSDGGVYDSESAVFSKDKPGDDPSETFMLREYREGDRHNLVHWKLSGRSDGLIVRELSKPISGGILIIADFGGCGSAGDADSILEAAAAVSAFLAGSGTAHTFAVRYASGGPCSAVIAGTDGFYAEMTGIAREAYRLDFGSGTVLGGADLGCYSRVIAVSGQCTAARAEELASRCGEAALTIICTAAPEPEETAADADIIYADAEKLSSRGELII